MRRSVPVPPGVADGPSSGPTRSRWASRRCRSTRRSSSPDSWRMRSSSDDSRSGNRAVWLVDANVLLYAVNETAPNHAASRAWLDGALNESVPVAFSWTALLAFLRLATHPAVFENPLTVDEATA